MTAQIITAIIALVGTLVGTFSGIVTSAKMTTYRIEQLEKKVDKHNNFAEKIPVIEEKIRVANHRLDDLERHIEEGDDHK